MKKFIFLFSMVLWVYQSFGQQFENVTETHLPAIVRSSYNSMDAAVGDLDGDGDLDIVVGVEFLKNIILLNDGNGKFTDGSNLLPDIKATAEKKPYPYYPYHDTEDIALADFDNDGDLDIVFVTEDDEVNEYYINDGKGNFTDVTDRLPVTGVSNAVIAADFDGDGYKDLMIGNKGQNYYLRNSKGTFIEETSKRMPAIDDITQDMEAYDFDGDGDLDVIVGNERANVLLLNDGKGNFTDATEKFIHPDFQISGETREADFADINGDGLIDLFFANVNMFQQMSPVQRLLINTGNGFRDETLQRIGFTDRYSCIDVDFVDLNGDKHKDLLLITYEGPVIMKNDGKGFFKDITAEAVGKLTTMGVDIEVADFNNDGKPDIYLANFRGSDTLLLQK